MGVYCLTVPEARGMRSRWGQGCVPSKPLEPGPSLPLPASDLSQCPWLAAASLQSLPRGHMDFTLGLFCS